MNETQNIAPAKVFRYIQMLSTSIFTANLWQELFCNLIELKTLLIDAINSKKRSSFNNLVDVH